MINKLSNSTISGGTDGTTIGNISDRLKTASTVYDSGGTESGTSTNPFTVAVALSYAPDLFAGRLFGASTEVNAAVSGSDNPQVLLRNPLNSGKNYFIYKVNTGCNVTNITAVFKVFGNPTLSSTVANISNITQGGLSTTVTVTTVTSHSATVGATAVIAGTTNFNGSWTVVSVTSATVYTFTRTPAPLFPIVETTGTSTVASSLGTVLNGYALKRVASPTAATALLTTIPTVSSNGQQLLNLSQGQNSTSPPLIDAAQISLEPGQTLLITARPASNNREMSISLIWSEVAV